MNDERIIEYQARSAMLDPMPISVLQQQRLPAARPPVAGPPAAAPPAAVPPAAAPPVARRPAPPASHAVDEALEDSFPASDPPPWTSGIARPASDLHQMGQLDRAASALHALLGRVAAF